MSSSEPDAHGRIHRAFEFDISPVPPAESSNKKLIDMSDGNRIPETDVLDYFGTTLESKEDFARRHKLDALVMTSAVGLSAVALGLAIHRLNKKK